MSLRVGEFYRIPREKSIPNLIFFCIYAMHNADGMWY